MKDDLVDGRLVLRMDDLERLEMMAVQLEEASAFLARGTVSHARLASAVVVLALIPLGHLRAVYQLVAVVVVMVSTAIIEDIPEVRRSGSTAIGDFGRTGGN